MGRPSLAAERRPQLLQAYAECLVRYGVEGTTLDRVAKQAGVTRGLVRHYLGNREQVIRALGGWAREGYLAWLTEISSRHAEDDAKAVLLEMWVHEHPAQLVAVLDALFAEAGKDAAIAEVLRSVYEAFFHWTVERLTRGFPDADPAARRQVALALMSFGWADTGFQVIGFRPTRGREYRAVAERLLDSLR
jgi:AcrR family transcriptional regulator